MKRSSHALVLAGAALAFAATVFTQQPQKPASPAPAKAAPTIAMEHMKDYFKKQSTFLTAQAQFQAAQQALNQTVNQMQADCGEQYRVQLGADGDPVCQAVPAAPAKK